MAIARFWIGYKIYLASIIGLIVMHEPSNLTMIPNNQIIEFAYSLK